MPSEPSSCIIRSSLRPSKTLCSRAALAGVHGCECREGGEAGSWADHGGPAGGSMGGRAGGCHSPQEAHRLCAPRSVVLVGGLLQDRVHHLWGRSGENNTNSTSLLMAVSCGQAGHVSQSRVDAVSTSVWSPASCVKLSQNSVTCYDVRGLIKEEDPCWIPDRACSKSSKSTKRCVCEAHWPCCNAPWAHLGMPEPQSCVAA